MKFEGFGVGNVNVSPGLVLAPMSGVTNTAFRRLIKLLNPHSVGLLVTEFISIEGLTRQNLRSLEMMRYCESERPVSIQIFGHDISRMAEAAQMVQDAGADIVDINSGCPVPKVVKRGGGCELMRQPEHMAQLLQAVRKRVSIPLTLKIRSGWDEQSKNAHEIGRIAQDSGVQMLAIHGRTRSALYRGDADWNVVSAVASELAIPVIGSGDIVDYASASDKLRLAVSGLMIGRGALYNPWIFTELNAKFKGEDYVVPGPEETPKVMELYRDLLREVMPDKGVIGKLKQFAGFVTRRVHGSSSVRKTLVQSRTVEEFSETLRRWEDRLSGRDCSAMHSRPQAERMCA